MTSSELYRELPVFFQQENDAVEKDNSLTGFLLFTYEINMQTVEEELISRILNIIDPLLNETVINAILRRRIQQIPGIIVAHGSKLASPENRTSQYRNLLLVPYLESRCMHAKIWIASFGNDLRLSIGSANLTEQGLGFGRIPNLESQVCFQWDSRYGPPVDTTELSIVLHDAILPLVKKIIFDTSGKKYIEWLQIIIKKLAKHPRNGCSSKILLSYSSTLENQLQKYGGKAKGTLSIVSPYLNTGSKDSLPLLSSDTDKINIYTQFEEDGSHKYLSPNIMTKLPNNKKFYNLCIQERDSKETSIRSLHSKLYQCDSWAIIGSANFTNAAWRTHVKDKQSGNLEAICVFRKKEKNIWNVFEDMISDEIFRPIKDPTGNEVEFSKVDDHLIDGYIHLEISKSKSVARIIWRKNIKDVAEIIWPNGSTRHYSPDWVNTVPDMIRGDIFKLQPDICVNISGKKIRLPLIIHNICWDENDFQNKVDLSFWFDHRYLISDNSHDRATNIQKEKKHKEQVKAYISIVRHIDAIFNFYKKWRTFYPKTDEDNEAIVKYLYEYFNLNNIEGIRAEFLKQYCLTLFDMNIKSKTRSEFQHLISEAIKFAGKWEKE